MRWILQTVQYNEKIILECDGSIFQIQAQAGKIT